MKTIRQRLGFLAIAAAQGRAGLFVRERYSLKSRGIATVSAVLGLCLLTAVALTFAVRAHDRSGADKRARTREKAGDASESARNSVAQTKVEVVQTERVTLLHDGFQPDSITIPAKKFFLAVDNRSGLTEMALRLDRQSGALIHSISIDHKKLDWSEVFELTPGTYVLSESNHPAFTCTITVTNK